MPISGTRRMMAGGWGSPPIDTKDPSLVLYYPLWYPDKETTGTPIISKDKNRHSGTVTDATWGSQGRSYNGTSAIITVPDNAAFDFGTSGLTLCWWAKTSVKGVGVNNFVVGKLLNGTTYDGFCTGHTTNGYAVFTWRTGSTNYSAAGSTDLADGKFHFVVALRNAVGIYVYVDGATTAVGSNTNANVQANVDNDQGLAIGEARTGSTSELWGGTIGEVTFYNRTLPTGEWQNYFLATKGRYK